MIVFLWTFLLLDRFLLSFSGDVHDMFVVSFAVKIVWLVVVVVFAALCVCELSYGSYFI